MNIYITLDYELYLGRKTGTPENCLFRPMSAIMDMLDKTGTKLTVFVDGAYLYRMNEIKVNNPSIQKDLLDVASNLQEISERGRSVQYHFHPQWLYSTYDADKGWIMDMDHYKLSDVPEERLLIAFKEGKDLIEKAIGKELFAFRAGGYSLCSYTCYGKLFDSNGIKIDSSVLPGKSSNSRFQVYDYRNTPLKSVYNFREDVCEESKNSEEGDFAEIPISCIPGKLKLNYWINLFLQKISRKKKSYRLGAAKRYGDGLSVSSEASKVDEYLNILKTLFEKEIIVASADSLSGSIFDVYTYLSKQSVNNMVIIGHPKAASEASIKNLERFIDEKLHWGDRFLTLDNNLK